MPVPNPSPEVGSDSKKVEFLTISGIKRRLEESDDEPVDLRPPSGPASSSTGPSNALGAGIRHRADAPIASSSIANLGLEAPDLPLLKSLKKDWGLGRLISPQVQEYARGALRQGALGMDRLAWAGSAGKHPQNMQRALIAAFGKPDSAPGITWFEIPTAKGHKTIHPFLLLRGW